MALLTKEVVVGWNNSNVKHYKSKGYEFTKNYDKFIVKTEDLPQSGSAKVDILCDSCGVHINTTYSNYNAVISKYDGEYMCLSCSRKKQGKKSLTNIDDLRIVFSNLGLILLSTEYSRGTKLQYECSKHKGIIQEKRFGDIKTGSGCPLCKADNARERQLGSKSRW